jgi:hypothetical protein
MIWILDKEGVVSSVVLSGDEVTVADETALYRSCFGNNIFG